MSNLELVNLLNNDVNFKSLKKKYFHLINEGVDINSVDRSGNSILMISVNLGLYKFTKLLLSNKKIDVNIKNRRGLSVIIIALFEMKDKKYQIQICNLLIKSGVDINLVNRNSFTPLCYASKIGDTNIFKFLLKLEKRYNFYDHLSESKSTPLIEAVKNNNLDIVKILIKFEKSEIYFKDEIGNCALLYACKVGNLDCVKLLLRKNNFKSINILKETSLLCALKSGNKDLVNYLLKNTNVDINCSDIYNNTALDLVCRLGYINQLQILLDKRVYISNNKYNGFISACKNGHIEIINKLLEYDVKTNYVDENNKSGFMYACINGNLELVNLLLSKDNNLKNNTNNRNVTPLMYSCLENQIDVVKLLIKNGVNINKYDNDGLNALDYACNDENSIDLVKLLLEKKIIKSKNVILNCISKKLEEISILLLESGYDDKYENLLLKSCKNNLYNLVNYIINKKSTDLNYYKYDFIKLYKNYTSYNYECKKTALLICCENNNLDLIKLLIKNKVDVNFNIIEGFVAFTIYCYYNKPEFEIGKLLLLNTDLKILDCNNQNILIKICNSNFNIIDKLKLTKLIIDKVDINFLDNFNKTALNYIENKFKNLLSQYFIKLNYDYIESYINLFLLLNKDHNELKLLIIKILNNIYKKNDEDKIIKLLKTYVSNDLNKLLFDCGRNNKLNLVKLLVNNYCDINLKDENGNTLIDFAYLNNSNSFMKYILDNGGYISYINLKKYKNKSFIDNNNIYKTLEKYELKLKNERDKNIRKLICMKLTDNTDFGGKTLINNLDIKSYVGLFM